MVRTKSDATVKVSGSKAPRKAFATPTYSVSDSSTSDSKSKAHGGGNSYHPRETPEWQKPITTFFGSPSSSSKGSDEAGISKDESSSDTKPSEAKEN